ncbi:MAG: hypothetical protein FJ137_08400 [Deltaproteobacteria bacterium]|nr:hypothetical protein [Deltaproteobacteria bacterium]
MSDPVGDDAPEGFLFELPAELSKAAPPARPTAAAPTAAQEAELAKAARVVAAAGPASVQHGRPAGAGNALAFHTWRQEPPTKGGIAPKKAASDELCNQF